jgi:hypothetical protein
MKPRFILVPALFLGLGVHAHADAQTAASDSAPLTLLNGTVVRVDAKSRVIIIRDPANSQRSLKVESDVKGLASYKRGDHVVVGLLGEPSRGEGTVVALRPATPPSVVAPVRSATGSMPTGAGGGAVPPPPEVGPNDVPLAPDATTAFVGAVVNVVPRADQLDVLWARFRDTCAVTVRTTYLHGRDWLSVWDNTLTMGNTSDVCVQMRDGIIAFGEPLRNQISTAMEDARRAGVWPGTVRDVLTRYALDWTGWDREPQRPSVRLPY